MWAKSRSWIVVAALIALVVGGCGTTGTEAEPGATIAGQFELVRAGDNGTLGAGQLEMTVSDDGTGITEATLELSDMSCTNEAGSISIESDGWSTTTTFVSPSPIIDGKFSFDISSADDTVSITGAFDSPTQASATVEINGTQRPPYGQPFECDYGSWTWSGNAQ